MMCYQGKGPMRTYFCSHTGDARPPLLKTGAPPPAPPPKHVKHKTSPALEGRGGAKASSPGSLSYRSHKSSPGSPSHRDLSTGSDFVRGILVEADRRFSRVCSIAVTEPCVAIALQLLLIYS